MSKKLIKKCNIEENLYYKLRFKKHLNKDFCCKIQQIKGDRIYISLSKLYYYNNKVLIDIKKVLNTDSILIDDLLFINVLKKIDIPYKLYDVLNVKI